MRSSALRAAGEMLAAKNLDEVWAWEKCGASGKQRAPLLSLCGRQSRQRFSAAVDPSAQFLPGGGQSLVDPPPQRKSNVRPSRAGWNVES